ncbi:hypothetical protein AURANDRAFT_22806, partial [Aureococcus anophagefferens]
MDQALSNFRQVSQSGREVVWVGSPINAQVSVGEQREIRERLLRERKYAPVFLDPKRERLFYDGFCKRVLWPLFHSSPPTTEDTAQLWSAYVSVNQAFADAVRDVAADGDLIWIQDYHFMLLPSMLRALSPHAKLGFFLHVPFPSSELYRTLPFREEVLHGLLAADLLGFQTYDYARHFLSSCEMVLGIETSPDRIEHDGHQTRVCVCPVGIEPSSVVARSTAAPTLAAIQRLESQLAGRTLFLGVDTLDPTKGLVHKLLAFEELFQRHPELADELVFVQVVLGRGGAATQDAEQGPAFGNLHAMVSRINSQYATLDFEGPVQYFAADARAMPGEATLAALFSLADVLVITPIRDGMNVVPFEYLVAREAHEKIGAVLLSEFAGCARSLGGAVLVNPWDTARLRSLRARGVERRRAHEHMLQYVSTFTARSWAKRFLDQLTEASETKASRTLCRELTVPQLLQPYAKTSRRLVVFELEGVLAKPTALSELIDVGERTLDHIAALCRDDCNRLVVVLSARTADALSRIFAPIAEKHVNLALAAEEGLSVRWRGDEPFEMQVSDFDLDMSWADDAAPLIEYYTERTPGSVVEKKESGLAWHYRDCDLNHGAWQARQLQVALGELAKHVPLSVFSGDKFIEVRPMRLSVPNVLDLALRRL